MSILYYPRPSQKTNLPYCIFIPTLKSSITCFGFRPGHMVSDVQLAMTKLHHKMKTSIKIHVFENITFPFCHKSRALSSQNNKSSKTATPQGCRPPLVPCHAPPHLPPPPGCHLLCQKEMMPQTKLEGQFRFAPEDQKFPPPFFLATLHTASSLNTPPPPRCPSPPPPLSSTTLSFIELLLRFIVSLIKLCDTELQSRGTS